MYTNGFWVKDKDKIKSKKCFTSKYWNDLPFAK